MTEARKRMQRTRWWLLSIATLLAVVATLLLGRWQLERAAQKALYQASVEERGQQAALEGSALLGALADETLFHRRIHVHGHWLAERTVYLDNRQMNAKPGFYVLTPLQLEGRSEVVLVQRGWVARNFLDRSQLPAVQTPSGSVTVAGRIAPPPAKLYELGDTQGGAIRQNLDWAQFKVETGLALTPLSIQQQGAPSEGLLRDWPQPASGIDKHYGYAFQWFGLSALITLLYVWFQIVRRFIAPKRP